MKTEDKPEGHYEQDTDLSIVGAVAPFLSLRTFIDVGAEKGGFAEFLLEKGFSGVLFEPCPKHAGPLKELAGKTGCRFFPYALDSADRDGELHLHCDEKGVPMDYYHSLQALPEDKRVRHQKRVPVTCRSLASLASEGILEKEWGIVKIDTEGNDLNVLKGMTGIRTRVLICEFLTPGLYEGWEDVRPERLVGQAEKMGFEHYLAVKRYGGRELVSFSPSVFFPGQWGNLIFLETSVFMAAFRSLADIVGVCEKKLFESPEEDRKEMEQLRTACDERLALIESLHGEAEKRLEIINRLERDLKAVQKEIDT